MNTDERQRTNLARIDMARAARELRVLGGGGASDQQATLRVLGRIERALDELAPVGGISVAETATTFGVSAPTVRKWLRKGLLEPAPSTGPQRVTFDSVERLDEILDRVGDSLPERDRTTALAAYLHDRDLAGEKWASAGIDAFEKSDGSVRVPL